MSSQADRYAIYYAPPPESALWRFGSAVLGYDGATGEEVPQIVPAGFDKPTWRLLTADPRVYAFHATIKAPFRLAEGQTEEALIEALGRFAAERPAFELARLDVAAVDARAGEGAFVALVESRPTPALVELEPAVVEAFEPFRAPLTDKEFARRLPETLTSRQRECLNRYGYPFVLENFRFHLTLTGRVPEDQVETARAGLAALHAQHVGGEPARFDALALYRQAAGAARFKVLARAPLGG
ncbi:DUF1045 domain-containing protein [Pseudochelatococcus sp. B33]